MHTLSVAVAPVPFAVRRVRERPLAFIGATLAFAGAAALIGWSSLAAALAQERSVRLHLAELPRAERAIRVSYYTQPLESDLHAAAVADAVNRFRDVAEPPRRVTIWHPISPADERGVRLVVPATLREDVEVTAGRLPAICNDRVCEALAVAGRFRVGQQVRLGKQTRARVVGLGALRPEVLPGRGDLGSRALVVPSVSNSLQTLVVAAGSTVVTTATLEPTRVHGFELRELSERLRQELVRLDRSALPGFVRTNAPLPLLDRVADRGEVARNRLLLVAGQAAALVLAFAAFTASTRRRELLVVDEQLTILGASRAQTATVRTIEALLPSAAGALLGLGAVGVAAQLVGDRRGLPAGFVGAALPLETVVTIAAVALVGCALLLVAGTRRRRSGFGVGPLEVAAVVALGAVVWQASTTGALDADRIAAGERNSPILLLVPGLAFFATGVLLLRVVPLALRLGERVGRRAPVGLRLSLLAAARNPAQTAAATTFLAVALGSALFSVDYRATLERQARDDAEFAAGARWRIVERSAGAASGNDVTPLTRFAAASLERPTPVFRLDGTVVAARSSLLPVRVLALPAARIPELRGWREDFVDMPRSELARQLRPWPVRLAGPKLAPDVSALRVWARSATDFPRVVVLHFLRRGQSFEHVRLGVVWRRWRLLRVSLDASLANAELVGVELVPTKVPIDFKYDPRGYVDLGRVEQRRRAGWSSLPPLDRWKETRAPDGTSGILAPWEFERAPVERGVRFELNGTFLPLIHPKLGLPDALPGYQIGPIPALASGPIAAQAVDGLLSLDLPGVQIPIRVVARARRFPTVVTKPSQFLVLDYDTLFAALNANRPGIAVPTEAWFFDPQRPDFAATVAKAPFRVKRAVGAEELRARLRNDPLAAGTREILAVAGIVAAALGLVGLVLATRATLADERPVLAEYEALGVAPRMLKRSTQARLLVVSGLGIAAGLLGALLAIRLVGATVAVTGTATRPILPIEAVVPWPALAAVVLAVTGAAVFTAALLAGRSLDEPAARRLRA